LLFVDASIYVRQYFDECCLGAVMTPVRRLQTGHHTIVVEVAATKTDLQKEGEKSKTSNHNIPRTFTTTYIK